MGIILTIAIPTYNRYETLKEAIDSIAEQWKETLSDKVEIIISDNGSTDNTDEITSYPGFNKVKARYYRNKNNIGPDRNFFNCWDKANGKYVMLLSDDDVLFPGTIEACVEILDKDPDILYLSVGEWNNRKNISEEKERLVEYSSDEQFIKALGLTITVLSSLVLKKEHISTDKLEKYVGTFFTQVYAVIDVMKYGNKKYIVRENASIGNRPGNQRSYNLYDQWLVYYQDALMHFTELGFSKKLCRQLFGDSIREHIHHWVYSFVNESTQLDIKITPQSVIRTMTYRESWKYLYRGMIRLWLTQHIKRGNK